MGIKVQFSLSSDSYKRLQSIIINNSTDAQLPDNKKVQRCIVQETRVTCKRCIENRTHAIDTPDSYSGNPSFRELSLKSSYTG
jgi:hypothetical protein